MKSSKVKVLYAKTNEQNDKSECLPDPVMLVVK
jgi:hypothetical protein